MDEIDCENKIKIEYIDIFGSMIGELPPPPPIGNTKIVTETEFKLSEGYTFHSTLEFDETQVRTKPDADLQLRPTSPDVELNSHLDMNTKSRLNKPPLPSQFECDVCGYKTKRKNHIRQHLLRHAGTPGKLACNQCPKRFFSTSKLNDHLRGVHTGERPFTCDICSIGFAIKSNLNQHIRMHIRKMNTKLPTYVCYICGDGVKYQRKTYLDLHMKQFHVGGALHSCNVCSAQFLFKNKLKQHLLVHTYNAAHPSDRPSKNLTMPLFKCSQCEYSTKYNNHLKIHFRKHSGERPYHCDICPAAFRSSTHLKRHQRTLHTNPYLKCNECSRKFGDKSELNQHVRIKHRGFKVPKRFECNICLLRTVSKANLERHLRIHTGEKNFQCPTCSKGFTLKSNMDRHVKDVKCHLRKRTAGLTSTTCPKCSKIFKTKTELSRHIEKVDCGRRTYECYICGKKFQKFYRLTGHLRTHDRHLKLKSTKCPHCSKVFKSMGSLRRHKNNVKCSVEFECYVCKKRLPLNSLRPHLRSHEGSKTCPNCSKTFTSKSHLRRHMGNVKCSRRATDDDSDGTDPIRVLRKRLSRRLQCSHCKFRSSFYDSLMDHIKNIHGISMDCLVKIGKMQ